MNLRLLPFEIADGYRNMAADEALLNSTGAGLASIRFYGWSTPTVSLGYFQEAKSRATGILSLPWVRRQTGGKTLVHHHELTYGLALPPGDTSDWLARMHRRVILPALDRLGLREKIAPVASKQAAPNDDLCFLHHTPGDLLCNGRKIVGSAQRKQRRCLLQHGSILLARSEHAAELSGIRELAGMDIDPTELQQSIVAELERETGWPIADGSWTKVESADMERLVREKYSTREWNEKR